jgi:hypothetical protein
VLHLDRESGVGADRRAVEGAGDDVVERPTGRVVRLAEQPGRDAEIEGDDAVEGEHGNTMGHGTNLTHYVVKDTVEGRPR